MSFDIYMANLDVCITLLMYVILIVYILHVKVLSLFNKHKEVHLLQWRLLVRVKNSKDAI